MTKEEAEALTEKMVKRLYWGTDMNSLVARWFMEDLKKLVLHWVDEQRKEE